MSNVALVPCSSPKRSKTTSCVSKAASQTVMTTSRPPEPWERVNAARQAGSKCSWSFREKETCRISGLVLFTFRAFFPSPSSLRPFSPTLSANSFCSCHCVRLSVSLSLLTSGVVTLKMTSGPSAPKDVGNPVLFLVKDCGSALVFTTIPLKGLSPGLVCGCGAKQGYRDIYMCVHCRYSSSQSVTHRGWS